MSNFPYQLYVDIRSEFLYYFDHTGKPVIYCTLDSATEAEYNSAVIMELHYED